MKRSHFNKLLFGLLILCSVASYVYLNAQQDNNVRIPDSDPVAVEVEESQEVILPDMALFEKLIDAAKIFTSYAPRP